MGCVLDLIHGQFISSLAQDSSGLSLKTPQFKAYMEFLISGSLSGVIYSGTPYWFGRECRCSLSERALFIHHFAIDIYFHSHIRVTGHRLEEWRYLKLRWCVDRSSNKDIKPLWLEKGDLPAINKSNVFLWAYQDCEDETHPSLFYVYEPEPKKKIAVTQTNIYRACAYTAEAPLFSSINMTSHVVSWT